MAAKSREEQIVVDVLLVAAKTRLISADGRKRNSTADQGTWTVSTFRITRPPLKFLGQRLVVRIELRLKLLD
jgi:hypothetical protein